MNVRGLLCWLLTLHSFPAFSADNIGPRLVSARVAERDATNLIYLELSERVISTTARNTNNYAVTLFGTTNQVPVTGAGFNPGAPPAIPPFISLRVATNNWHLGGVSNYYVTVNNLQDLASNNIAPNSRVGISWPRYAELLGPGSEWHYQAYPLIESNLLEQAWTSCDFRESSWWRTGVGPFDPLSGSDLGGPAFFRTSFVCPPDFAAAGRLRLDYLVDAAAVFYLNGVELGRVNLFCTSAQLNGGEPCCTDFIIAPPLRGGWEGTVTNLVAGTNWLAVAVLPCYCLPAFFCAGIGPGGFGISFDLYLQAIRYVAGPLPVEDPPMLKMQWLPDHRLQLSWIGSGYALEAATNLPPAGRWAEVSDMSNPYVLSLRPNSSRFFRLRR